MQVFHLANGLSCTLALLQWFPLRNISLVWRCLKLSRN